MKKIVFWSILLLSCFCGRTVFAAAESEEGIKIDWLGGNHLLLRISGHGRYLLLPVEETAPEAHIRILGDNKIRQELTIRLALNRVDYFVPLDLAPCEGLHVALDIRMENSRANVRDLSDDLCWSEIRLSDSFDTANRERFRPAYHFTPAYGWMNDPNGMFFKDDAWHLYYQYNPYGSMWGNMHWGHAVSRDLMQWEHLPVALSPDALGTVFSGSSVVDHHNTAGFGAGAVVSLYTSAGEHQMQSLAYSTDNGRTFTTWPLNPVIASDKECRDPNLFWDEPRKRWVLILAVPLEREMWIYTSPDLKNWTKRSAFGRGYGEQKGIWECPDLLELPVRGSDRKKWVLLCNLNPGGPHGNSATQYFVGDFDGDTFRCDSDPGTIKWLDYGMDHYAAVSWSNAPDGRHTIIAWMSNWQYANLVPTMQFRSAMSLPREPELFEGADGELYLAVTPAPEVDARRGKAATARPFTVGSKGAVRMLPPSCGGVCEIDLGLTPAKGCDRLRLTLANDRGEEVVMICDFAGKKFEMDRTKSGNVGFSKDFPAVTTAPMPDGSGCTLRFYLDRSSLEVFEEQGRFSMTNLVFPETPYTKLTLSTDKGRCRVNYLKVYPIKHDSNEYAK